MFKELSEIAKNRTWQMSVSEKEGIMTVSMVPMTVSEQVHPIILTGTPEQLDEEFGKAIKAVKLDEHKLIEIEAYQKSLKNKKTTSPKKKEEKKEEETKQKGLEI